MVEMTTTGRRIYNRTASTQRDISSPTSPPSSTPPTPQTTKKPASPPPPTLAAPTAPVGAKKKKKKRSKGKSNVSGGVGAGPEGHGVGSEPLLGDEDLDYSRRDGDDDDRDLTDDDIPDLVDIDRPSLPQSHSIPMTTTSSASSKTPTTISAGSKSKKKKKKTKSASIATGVNGIEGRPVSRTGDNSHRQKIWNTTTAEEKERIKEFWLGLSEQERRNLVRVEKEHVSKRVKEGSKILNCSCHVCGRKQ